MRVRIAGIDLLTLELHAVLLARIDTAPATDTEAEADDESADAGTLRLAIELDAPADVDTAPQAAEQQRAASGAGLKPWSGAA